MGNILKISIITVVFNGEEHIEECIKSVIGQTYPNIEYLIIDGGSSDNTLPIISKYKNKVDCIISEKDKGIYNAMNKGANIAKGDYLLFLNSDDFLAAPTVIEAMVNSIEGKKLEQLVVGSIAHAFKKEIYISWTYPRYKEQLLNGNPPHPSTLIPKSFCEKFPYDESLKYAGDYDLWLTLRMRGMYDPIFVPITTSIFRLGGISSSGNNEYTVSIELEISNYKHGLGFNTKNVMKGYIRWLNKYIFTKILGHSFYYQRLSYIRYALSAKNNKNI